MRIVLDAHGLTSLSTDRAKLEQLRARGSWPPEVPAVVLVEALTGDHRRDFHVSRLLRTCQIRSVDEPRAREAARLRAATGRPGTISATDAIVAAFAAERTDSVVLTSDPRDLAALAAGTAMPFRVVAV